ncbi:peroxisomal succinyl-coenzyme A thioesterase-like isoform X1 [Clupea harengus]|uniref:Peroxisomal succinyl-coenzyme A thioesterase-like isoform X1 n=2 Tax=Clupea harengus TaxID=7950 RepID=A0A6P8GH43_CLUHA|nr:peroxisomal succinyl-coenzyme A thioesterase-like isoform X1 [Clupea harengus]
MIFRSYCILAQKTARVLVSGRHQLPTCIWLSLRRSASSMAVCPVLSVQPTRALVDEKFQIVVRNLHPKQEVTVHSLHHSEDKDYWEAFGHYISDENGTVTVMEDASRGGTYTGTEPMGLLWSLRPIPGSRHGLRMRKKNVLSPMVVNISVYKGHMNQGFSEEAALATVVTERWYLAPGVQRVDIREQGVKGTLFIPPGPGLFPAVLDMWGGGGGLVEYRAALLASHGFVALALQYLTPNKERTLDIETGYFEMAYHILQSLPQVSSDRVAVLGLSFGASVTLTLAAYSKTAKPRCCVCISGSHVHPVNKTLFEFFQLMNQSLAKSRIDENNHVIWRDVILPIPTEPDLKVDVGKIKCPLLVVIAQDDQSWATVESTEDMEQIMERSGNRHLLTVLSYPDAGHLIEPPYTPHIRFSNFINQHNREKVIMLWGGQTKPHADAQEDAWEKILLFLQKHLYQDIPPEAKL